MTGVMLLLFGQHIAYWHPNVSPLSLSRLQRFPTGITAAESGVPHENIMLL